MSQELNKPDGRRLRTTKTRAAIARALVDLAGEGIRAPTKEQIAERAGVSARAVFIHFPNVSDLARAELAGILDEFAPEPGEVELPALELRLQRYIERAMRVHARMAPVQAIAGMMEPLQDALRHTIDEIGERLVREALASFALELAALPPAARLDSVVAIAALVAPSTWAEFSRLALAAGRPPTEIQKSAIRRLLGC